MTAKDLSQLYYLSREIEQDVDRLATVDAMVIGSPAHITVLPHLSGITDTPEMAAAVENIKTVIKEKNKMNVMKSNRLKQYISDIEDNFMRQIMTLRHIDGMKWKQVAMTIGGGNTADSIRKAHSRYLEKN